MKKKRWGSVAILQLAIVCASFSGFLEGCAQEQTPSPLNLETIDEAINRSADYLIKATKQDGMFDYRINMDPDVTVTKKYNILRHAGTIFAMSMSYQRHAAPNMRSAIERAGAYLRDDAMQPILPGPRETTEGSGGKLSGGRMLAIWSKPKVNGGRNPLQVKLGGTGLGLVALLSLEKISPGFTPLEDLQALGRSIIYMQKNNGSFYSKYIPSKGGRQDAWTSLYYPGEAALGMLMLYEKDPRDPWLQSASRALQYLARSRENRRDTPADHWALLATEKILSLENNPKLPISKKLLIRHAIQICQTMLRDQVNQPLKPQFDGGFAKDGRTTPSAIRLEGLLAAQSFLPPNHEIQTRLDAAITRGLIFLLQAQIREGPFVGSMPRAVAKQQGNSSKIKSFNRRATEVRIDYVQHAMSAMIQYTHRMKNESP